MKNTLIAFVSGLVVASVGYSFTQPQTPILKRNSKENVITISPDVQAARAKLQTIFDVDIQEYQSLKNMRARYEKANDILAKIMTVFLADLGLRVSQKDIERLTESEIEDSDEIVASSGQQCQPLELTSCPSLSDLAEQAGKKLVSKTAGKKPSRDWVKNERDIEQVSTPSDIEDFLDSVKIPDFFGEVASAKAANRQVFNSFLGTFKGRLEYFEPEKNPPADVHLELNAEFEDGKIVGQKIMKLSRNGEVFSNSTGNGLIEDYKLPKNTGQAVFVDLGGKTGFFQLYFIDGGNTLIGNFYRQTSVSKFRLAGKTKLKRQL